MTAAAPLVRHAFADGLATITLARPQAGNAMSWDLIADLATAVDAVLADGTVRAILIEAEGRHFCVGGDINAFASEADPAGFIRRLADALHGSVVKLAGAPVPVIVAAQGAAAGAGFSLVAGGDVVLAAESATFQLAYPGIGLTADGGATWLLPRLVGLRRAQDLFYTGRRLTAAEAADWGLVTRVVADDALADEARALAAAIAAGPTLAFGGIKRLLADADSAPLAAHLDAEAEAIGRMLATGDAQGAVAAFVARRKPVFAGR